MKQFKAGDYVWLADASGAHRAVIVENDVVGGSTDLLYYCRITSGPRKNQHSYAAARELRKRAVRWVLGYRFPVEKGRDYATPYFDVAYYDTLAMANIACRRVSEDFPQAEWRIIEEIE